MDVNRDGWVSAVLGNHMSKLELPSCLVNQQIQVLQSAVLPLQAYTVRLTVLFESEWKVIYFDSMCIIDYSLIREHIPYHNVCQWGWIFEYFLFGMHDFDKFHTIGRSANSKLSGAEIFSYTGWNLYSQQLYKNFIILDSYTEIWWPSTDKISCLMCLPVLWPLWFKFGLIFFGPP